MPNAATRLLPDTVPPAAITGILTALTTCGIKDNVVFFLKPLSQPAS